MKRVSQIALLSSALALFVVLFNVCPAEARTSGLLMQGLKEYNQRDNLAAYNSFRKVLLQNPDDGLARYFVANILVRLGKIDEAINQYQCAFWLCQDPAIRRYCQAALQTAGVLPGTPAAIAAADPATPVFMRAAGNLTQTAGTIDQQVSTERSRLQSADAVMQNMASDHVAYASTLEKNASSVLASQEVRTSRGTYTSPEAQAYYAWEMRRASNIRSLANEWSSNQQRVDSERAISFEQSAESIKQQLGEQQYFPPSAFHMVSQGTNLYVRNYQSQAAPLPVPLVAIPKTLTPITGHRANTGRLHVASSDPQGQKKVRGLLLDARHKMEVGD